MKTVREAWTEERLDEEFKVTRSELRDQISEVHRLIVRLSSGMIATMIIGFSVVLIKL